MNLRKSHWPVFNVGVLTQVKGRVVLCGFNIRSVLGHFSACLGISEYKRNNAKCCCVCNVTGIAVRICFFYADTCVD
jgi:hypothetical protein